MPLSPQAKRRLIIGGVILALLVIAAPFAWQAAKERRAIYLAEDALALLEDDTAGDGRYAIAWESAKAAYALDPENPFVARTLAGIVNQADPNNAPALWEDIYALTGEEEDLLAWFDSTHRLRQFDTLKPLAERLAEQFPDSPEALKRRAIYALTKQNLGAAIKLMQQAAATPDASTDIQFAYVKLSQQSPDESVREAGVQWLKDMAKRPDNTGLLAARAILTSSDMSREQILIAASILAKHPLAEREDRLTEIMIRRRTGDQDVNELIAEAKALFDLEDRTELVELGRWLNQQNRSEDFLQLVDYDTAITRRDLFLVWVDAMAYTNQWNALKTIVERPRVPLDPFTVVLFRSRIEQELGKERVSDLIWGQALIAAKEDINKLDYAYSYALKLGWNERAREVLERLAKIPTSQRVAYEKLIELDQTSGNIEALRTALRRMAEQYPDDTDVAGDLAYVNLLMGEDIQASAETAARLLQESERPYLANIITLALAYYLAGQKEAALNQLYPLPIDWAEARPGYRAIYAAILAANGHHRESQSMMEGVNPDDLLPPERDILKQARL